MAEEIRCDYDEMEQISTQFNNLAQVLDEVQQKVRGSYAKLVDKGWIGLGAEAFFDEMDSQVLPSQARLGQALEKAAQSTQRIARVVKEAEDNASSLFRS